MTDAPRYTRTVDVSWETLHRDAQALASRLADGGPWRGIVAVSRGGLVPAAIVAKALGVRVVDTLCIASYTGRAQGEPRVLKGVDGDGRGWLIVDDLVDTGETARVVRERLPEAHFATVYAKPAGRPFVDTYLREVSQDTWITFPWDAEPQAESPAGRGGGR